MSSQDTRPTKKFNDLIMVEKINEAKFEVYQAHSESMDQSFALKVFPYINNKINPFFTNETRFIKLSHPNVISILHSEREKIVNVEGSRVSISYTVMELAPYGDFFDLVLTKKIPIDDKLARTYFHQLIQGLEYLHEKNVAHLDIKPENLLIGENFQLKIADFDSSVRIGSQTTFSTGTCYYRAPEVADQTCATLSAADIYSAAIILFFLKCAGVLPHLEHEEFSGYDLLDVLENDNELFWDLHCKIQAKPESFFDQEFKDLFSTMTDQDPDARPTISEIKESAWYNQSTYSSEELQELMKGYYC